MIFNCSTRSVLLSALILYQLLPVHCAAALTNEDIQASLLEQLGQNPSEPFAIESPGVVPSAADPLIVNVYRENGFEPLWVNTQGPTPKAAVLLKYLSSSADEGLDPEDYQASRIEAQWHAKDSGTLAGIDILLTTALHAYVSDVREGRLDPCLNNPELFTCARDRSIDPVDLTGRAMDATDLGEFLEQQPPDNDQYRLLKGALNRYREIERNGGWQMVPDGPSLKPGMNDPRIPRIRERLAATSLLPAPVSDADPLIYDDTTAAAVMQFQKRHGLEVDGIIGNATRRAMNAPVSSIIRQIVLNMERLRWLSRGTGDYFVIVNIAGFELAVIKDAQRVCTMPVIVGKHYRETPVFSDQISYIEFNPFWNIPPSIAQRDILPKLKKDPSYLSDMGISVFDGWFADARKLDPAEIQWETVTESRMAAYKLRQDPGPKNSLGRVKFMFPNRFSVYLHDTPSQELFQRTVRTFSSGCIRLSRPLELAVLLLGGESQGWDMDKANEVVDNGHRTIVKLPSPVPIHIVYLTVYADADGCVCFKKDVYGRDVLLEKALFQETP